MINKLTTFDPTVQSTGQLDTRLNGRYGTLYLINESLESLLLGDDTGRILGILPALWASPLHITYPPASINWTVISTQALIDTTIHQVQGVSYSSEEDTSKLYSGPLNRVTGLGNPGGIAVGTTTVENDGNSAGTLFVGSIVSGQTNHSVSITNDGIVNISVLLAGVLTTLIQTATSGSLLQLGALNQLTEVLGSLTVDQSIHCNNYTDSAGNDGVSITPGTKTRLASAALVALQVPNGTDRVSVNSTSMNVSTEIHTNAYHDSAGNDGVVITPGSKTRVASSNSVVLQVPSGSDRLSVTSTNVDIASGSGFSLDTVTFHGHGTITRTGDTSGTGTGTFNHNLGVSPDYVSITTHAVGSQTVGYDSETSTQLHITTGAALAWFAFLLKR